MRPGPLAGGGSHTISYTHVDVDVDGGRRRSRIGVGAHFDVAPGPFAGKIRPMLQELRRELSRRFHVRRRTPRTAALRLAYRAYAPTLHGGPTPRPPPGAGAPPAPATRAGRAEGGALRRGPGPLGLEEGPAADAPGGGRGDGASVARAGGGASGRPPLRRGPLPPLPGLGPREAAARAGREPRLRERRAP